MRRSNATPRLAFRSSTSPPESHCASGTAARSGWVTTSSRGRGAAASAMASASAPLATITPKVAALCCFSGLVISALMQVAQTHAQTRLRSSEVAVIGTTKPLFALLFAVVCGIETATSSALLGGLLIAFACLAKQIDYARIADRFAEARARAELELSLAATAADAGAVPPTLKPISSPW